MNEVIFHENEKFVYKINTKAEATRRSKITGKVFNEYQKIGYRLEKHIPNLFDYELKE